MVLGGFGLYDISDHIKLIAFHIVRDGHNKNLGNKPVTDYKFNVSSCVACAES